MHTVDTTGVLVFQRDEAGKIIFGAFRGGDTPTTADKFAAGCVLLGNGKVYTNAGTSASPSFQDINDISTSEIAAGAVTLAKLASGITPSHVVKFAGSFTTAGGDANESITVAGCLGTDIAIVVLKTKGATPRTILTAAAGTDAIAVEMSGDPSTDHVLSYMVLRAAA